MSRTGMVAVPTQDYCVACVDIRPHRQAVSVQDGPPRHILFPYIVLESLTVNCLSPPLLGYRRFVAVLALVTAVAGCGDDDQMHVVPVHGLVTIDGKPLEFGSVTFVGATSGLPPASGDINPDGTYEMETYEEGDGAAPGSYRVMISAVNEAALTGNPDLNVTPVFLIPARYSRDKDSGLTAEVKDQEDNVIHFELKSE